MRVLVIDGTGFAAQAARKILAALRIAEALGDLGASHGITPVAAEGWRFACPVEAVEPGSVEWVYTPLRGRVPRVALRAGNSRPEQAPSSYG